METKLAKLLAMMRAEQWVEAMRLAKSFADLGAQKAIITRAWDARQSPSLYRQMGKDPEALWAAGIEALTERYLREPELRRAAREAEAGRGPRA